MNVRMNVRAIARTNVRTYGKTCGLTYVRMYRKASPPYLLRRADLSRANPQPLGDGGFVHHVRGDLEHQSEHVLWRCVNPDAVDTQKRQANHVGSALVRIDIAMVLRSAEDVAGRTFKKTSAGVLEPMPSTRQGRLDAAVIDHPGIAPV